MLGETFGSYRITHPIAEGGARDSAAQTLGKHARAFGSGGKTGAHE